MSPPLTIALANSGRRWIGEVAHVAMLYEQLEAAGQRPWIVCRRGFALERFARERDWRVLALHFRHGLTPWHDAQDVSRWLRLVRREGIDLLHCHRGKDHWLGIAVARLGRRPLVRTRHVVMPVRRHPFNRWLYLRATDAVICVSRAVQAGFGPWQPHLPLSRVILSAVDPERFDPRRRSDAWRRQHVSPTLPQPPAQGAEPVWFGLVGRYHAIKGHDVFLEAAAQVARDHPTAHFMIAGQGSRGRKKAMQARAAELGIGDRVWTARNLPNLPKVLASMDVGVIASLGSEGSSRIALEMMASGLPLVASAVGGIPELTEPSGAARLATPGDAGALAAAMAAWLTDPEARGRAGQAAREHMLRRHHPQAWIEAVLETYASIRH